MKRSKTELEATYRDLLAEMANDNLGLQHNLIDGLRPIPSRSWRILALGIQDKLARLHELSELFEKFLIEKDE